VPAELLPNRFSCAPVGRRLGQRIGPYQGYARAGAAHRPLFPFEEAERIAAAWRALPAQRREGSQGATPDEASPEAAGSGYHAHYDHARRAFRFYDAEADVWHTWEGEKAGVATLFPIGEGGWRWECGG